VILVDANLLLSAEDSLSEHPSVKWQNPVSPG